MATIKDVAKAAGVSISTTSYALNDDPRIPDSTASRIKKVANEIGYFPSAAARNLKKRSTKTILVAIADFGGPVYHELLEGIQSRLSKDNYTMIVSTGLSSENLLKERSCDGAIITDIHISDDILLKIAKNFSPIVVLDRSLSDGSIYNMTIDNHTAMHGLVEKIIAKGYQKIAFVHGVVDTYDNITRYQGCLSTINHAGIPLFAEHYGNFTKQSGERIAYELLETKAKMPEIFVCANDEMAVGIMDVLKAAGYKIPQDIAVTGFDDIELAHYYQPGLSTVKIRHAEWGQAIADAVIKLLKNETVDIKKQQGEVIIRQSF